MSKRNVFTTITPLPAGVTRQIVLDFLHDHEEMIDLNPLVKERHPIPTPSHAPADEQHCQWYSLTDKISYLPGVAGDVTYTCAFNDLPTGIQTHCYAPAGLTIRDKWTVGGSLPGEPRQHVELGVSVPPTGLYLREDVDMRCNVIMGGFVKKTLKKSHAALVDRLKIKAEIASASKGGKKSNRDSDSTITPPKSKRLTFMGSSEPSSFSDRLSKFSPTSRRSSSAASSVVSTTSSASCYSVKSSPMWSPPASSRGTSPALSVTSPPPTHNDNYQLQPQARPGEYLAQPKQQFLAPHPAPIPQPPPEPASFTLPAAATEPETPFLRKQQPLPVVASTPLPLPEPQTPFLRKRQPDWPLKSLAPAPLQPRQPAAAAAAADWPLRKPRPQTQLFIQAYRPPPAATATGPSNSNSSNSSNSSTARDNSSGGGGGGGELSDAALWQALGGGRFVAAKNAASYNANANANADNNNNNNNRKNVYAHARARSYGGPQGQGQGQGVGSSASHPEYPHMSPYDDGDGVGGGKGDGGGGYTKAVVWQGVMGRVRAGRGVSMPPSVRAGSFVAEMD